jgi:Zn-dependent M28 family amino/carboxypeptidase
LGLRKSTLICTRACAPDAILDDNGSGASVLTEIARNLNGVPLEYGLQVIGFGAEEEGLQGSKAFVNSLSASQRENMLAMINLDSLITGDMMYAHSGKNSVSNRAWPHCVSTRSSSPKNSTSTCSATLASMPLTRLAPVAAVMANRLKS